VSSLAVAVAVAVVFVDIFVPLLFYVRIVGFADSCVLLIGHLRVSLVAHACMCC
jgi:hypothetical protein